MSQGETVKEEILREKPICDSVAEDLILDGELLIGDMKALKKEGEGARTFQYWVEFNPEAEKQAKKEAKALAKAELKAEILAEMESETAGEEVTEIDQLRVEYEQVIGKPPHHMKKEKGMREEIAQANKPK